MTVSVAPNFKVGDRVSVVRKDKWCDGIKLPLTGVIVNVSPLHDVVFIDLDNSMHNWIAGIATIEHEVPTVSGTMPKEEQHIAGISPEVLDPDAFREFMRSL